MSVVPLYKHLVFFVDFLPLTLTDKCLTFSSTCKLCVSVNDQRWLHGGVYNSGFSTKKMFFGALTQYIFRRVTK